MQIEILNEIYGHLTKRKHEDSMNLKVCGSYGIYLNSFYLQNHLKGDKLVSDSLNYFIQNYSSPRDIDLIAPFYQKNVIKDYFSDLGFQSDRNIESIPGIKRHIFIKGMQKVDVFYDVFDFNHRIDMSYKINSSVARFEIKGATIPLTELLLQKLQIIEIGQKDLIGAWWLINEHEIYMNSDEGINLSVLQYYLSNDWGFYHTVTNNLANILALSKEDDTTTKTFKKIKKIQNYLHQISKGLKWNVRSKIGSRIKWYNEVDNV